MQKTCAAGGNLESPLEIAMLQSGCFDNSPTQHFLSFMRSIGTI